MKKLLVAFFILGLGYAVVSIFGIKDIPPEAQAILCIKTGERTSGLNKICYYSCAGSQAAITVKAHELCPSSIDN